MQPPGAIAARPCSTIARWNASGMLTIGRPEITVPTSSTALLTQDVDQPRGIAVDHPHLREALAQILEQRAVELDHHHRLGRQAGIDQRLRDRAGAGAKLDHHLTRLPDDLAGHRPRQRSATTG